MLIPEIVKILARERKTPSDLAPPGCPVGALPESKPAAYGALADQEQAAERGNAAL